MVLDQPQLVLIDVQVPEFSVPYSDCVLRVPQHTLVVRLDQ
jgi:hypothetical protein